MASTLARNSASRTDGRSALTSAVSAAGLRISPSSPPVQHTSAARMPSAAYRATVPGPFDASSSGCACTDTRHNGLPATSSGGIAPKLAAALAVATRTPAGTLPRCTARGARAAPGRYIASMSRRPLACFVALACALATWAAVAPAGAAAVPSSNGLSPWHSCGKHVQCATLTVPVDYAHPDGEQVKLAVSRVRATDRAHRVGSLVLNFGGPGDAGSETLRSFAPGVPSAVRARYDLVSFDPRGTGKSRPAECVNDADADRLNAVDPTPDADSELPSFYDGSHEPVDLVAQCIARN